MSGKTFDAATILSVGDDGYELVTSPQRTLSYAVLEELHFVWREAQAEATMAYADWRQLESGDAYAVYRAAQDRADAAQDALADWATCVVESAV